MPPRPAARLLITIAAAITPPSSRGCGRRSADRRPRSAAPSDSPLASAMVISRRNGADVFELGQLVGRQRADRDRERLRAGIAAHSGDDRHQHRKHRISADLALEQADDAGGERSRCRD